MKITKPILRCFLLLLCGLLFIDAQLVYAQSGTKVFRNFTSRDGIPSQINSVIQDQKGVMWITGQNGLSTFDGYNVRTFTNNPDDEFSIPEGRPFELFEDMEGNIWTSGSYGISVFDPKSQQFTLLSVPDSLPAIRSGQVLQTTDRLIWVLNNEGVFKVSPSITEQSEPNINFYKFDSEIEPDQRLFVLDMIEGDDGLLWIATNLGPYQFNPITESFNKLGPFNEEINELFRLSGGIIRDQNNSIWQGVEGGLLIFREGGSEPELITTLGENNFSLTDVQIIDMYVTKDQTLWLGTVRHGALNYNPVTNTLIQYKNDPTNPESIADNIVLSILEDQDGNMWFNSFNIGLNLMYEKPWNYEFNKIIDTNDITNDINDIYDLHEAENTDLWAAPYSGLAYIPNDGSPNQIFYPVPEDTSSENEANWIFKLDDNDGELFVSTYERTDVEDVKNELYRFDIENKRFITIELPDSIPAPNNFEASDSYYYWVVDGTNQLMQLSKEDYSLSTIELPVDYPERDNEADTLSNLRILISTLDTIYLQHEKTERSSNTSLFWEYYQFNPDLQAFSKVDLTPLSDINLRTTIPSVLEEGVFFSSTNRGILKENLITGENSLLNEWSTTLSVFSLFEDKNGFIWYTESNSSLVRFNPITKKVNTFYFDLNRRPRNLTDGIQLMNNDLAFFGTGGYIQFNPDEVQEEKNIQSIFINELRAGSESFTNLNPTDDYEIDYENNNISVSYTGINYRSTDNQYRYRLLGYRDEWVDAGTQRSLFLANLPFGEYNFQVQSTINGSSFTDNSATAVLNITILPPWWRTLPAYIFFALLLTGSIYSFDHFQRKRLLSREREKSRDKEIAQAKEIEKAYEHLKAAQEQLVQQEKLASLGQLTAGIAHEIKNPLNFVNNFSQLSEELLIELKEAVDNEDHELTNELFKDINQNLKKIHEHGSRADSIVRSMLEHSRGGSGKLEDIDLNALLNEFVNLSFHGMRAGKSPINVDLQFELDESIKEIPLISEDFSRVIINLCNNSFDAMREKVIQNSEFKIQNYTPILTIRTKQAVDGKIILEIEDNGPGIPEEMKDKILQPFFTTKKGTEGTGLGLSITNDIIKAHGGELDIESDTELGTIFSITLTIGK